MQSLVVLMLVPFLAPTGDAAPAFFFRGDNGALQAARAGVDVAAPLPSGVLRVADCAMVIDAGGPATVAARDEDTPDAPGLYVFETALVIEAGARPGRTYYHTDAYGIVVARTDGDRGDVYVQNDAGSLGPARVFAVAADGALVAADGDAAGPRYWLDELGMIAAAE